MDCSKVKKARSGESSDADTIHHDGRGELREQQHHHYDGYVHPRRNGSQCQREIKITESSKSGA